MSWNVLGAGAVVGAFAAELGRVSPILPPVGEIAAGVFLDVEAAQYVGARALGGALRAGATTASTTGNIPYL